MSRSLFVDFLYAVVVSVAISRITADMLCWNCYELWGLLFLVAVFIEDYYLYHKEIRPFLKECAPSVKSLVLEVAIVLSWYFSQAAFPKKIHTFAFFLGLFYALKLAGGFKMTDRLYPWNRDVSYVIPVIAGAYFGFSASSEYIALFGMATAWLITVLLWWVVIPNRERACA